MNEGCATYCHYKIMGRLFETGQISEGSYLEFLTSHTNVVMQPQYDDQRFGGINPYALGFAMMEDIERVVTEPTAEDREWFPDIAGRGDASAVLGDVWANYRDESFVSQFLSPHLIRRWKMFQVQDDGDPKKDLRVGAIHDERGYRNLRRALSRHYDVAWQDPDIQVVDVERGADVGARDARRAPAPRRPVGLRRPPEGGRRRGRQGFEGAQCQRPADLPAGRLDELDR